VLGVRGLGTTEDGFLTMKRMKMHETGTQLRFWVFLSTEDTERHGTEQGLVARKALSRVLLGRDFKP